MAFCCSKTFELFKTKELHSELNKACYQINATNVPVDDVNTKEYVDILQLRGCVVALIVMYLDTRFISIAILSFYSFIYVLFTLNQVAKIDKYIKLLTGTSKTLIKFHSSRDLYFFLLSAVAVSNFKEADKQM